MVLGLGNGSWLGDGTLGISVCHFSLSVTFGFVERIGHGHLRVDGNSGPKDDTRSFTVNRFNKSSVNFSKRSNPLVSCERKVLKTPSTPGRKSSAVMWSIPIKGRGFVTDFFSCRTARRGRCASNFLILNCRDV